MLEKLVNSKWGRYFFNLVGGLVIGYVSIVSLTSALAQTNKATIEEYLKKADKERRTYRINLNFKEPEKEDEKLILEATDPVFYMKYMRAKNNISLAKTLADSYAAAQTGNLKEIVSSLKDIVEKLEEMRELGGSVVLEDLANYQTAEMARRGEGTPIVDSSGKPIMPKPIYFQLDDIGNLIPVDSPDFTLNDLKNVPKRVADLVRNNVKIEDEVIGKFTAESRLEFTNSTGMKFVLIKAGTFMMGEENSSSQHRVTLTKDFYMQTTEVTQAQYEMICDNFHLKNKDRPAVWPQNYVIEFCEKISEREKKHYRLPTEAEWEYACRAGSTKKFYFGDDESKLKEYAWYKGSIDFQPFDFQPGGKKKPNAWGLYDMLGNAWEWCSDIYGEYPKESVVDPIGPKSGDNEILVRVIKGGGVWYNSPPTCYLRESGEPDISAGFRCVLEKNSLNSQKTTPSRSERKDIVSPKDACVYNLKQIKGAIERCGLENNMRNGDTVTMTQLVNGGYLESAPSCPAIGPYSSNQKVGFDPLCPGWERSDARARYHVLP